MTDIRTQRSDPRNTWVRLKQGNYHTLHCCSLCGRTSKLVAGQANSDMVILTLGAWDQITNMCVLISMAIWVIYPHWSSNIDMNLDTHRNLWNLLLAQDLLWYDTSLGIQIFTVVTDFDLFCFFRREKVLKELVTTEERYVDDLNQIITGYKDRSYHVIIISVYDFFLSTLYYDVKICSWLPIMQ